MPEVEYLSPKKDQAILTTHMEVVSRATRGTGVVSGNGLTPTEPASMQLTCSAGRIRIAGEPFDTLEDAPVFTAAHATYPRIDVVYRDTDLSTKVKAGTPAIIEDPKGLSQWKSYTSPVAPEEIPDGASILAAVYIPAESTSIPATNVWMFAGGVEDLATEVGTPGVNTKPISEKAARDLAGTLAPAAKGVTNGDTHDHSGGDGAQINHTTLSNIGTKTHATLDSHVDSTSNPHGTTASQVGADITVATAHAATAKNPPEDNDELMLLDSGAGYGLKKLTIAVLKALFILKTVLTTRGDLLYRDATGPARLAKGTAGQRLSQGADDPAWSTAAFEVPFPFGDGSGVLVAGNCYCPIPIACKITKAEIRSVDATGALLSGSVTCTLYKHARDAAPGSTVDTFALASATNMVETGLNIAVAAGDYLTVVTSGITSVKQIVLTLTMEPT